MASEIVAVAEKKEKQRKLEEALEKIKTLETACTVKDEMVRQTQAQSHLYEDIPSQQRRLEEALEKIKTLETGFSTNPCDMLPLKNVVQDNLAIAQALMSPRAEAATSTTINAFDGFNSDLTLQLDAARSLNDALRQQMRDEQERADALQKQLVRAKEQVHLLAPTLA